MSTRRPCGKSTTASPSPGSSHHGERGRSASSAKLRVARARKRRSASARRACAADALSGSSRAGSTARWKSAGCTRANAHPTATSSFGPPEYWRSCSFSEGGRGLNTTRPRPTNTRPVGPTSADVWKSVPLSMRSSKSSSFSEASRTRYAAGPSDRWRRPSTWPASCRSTSAHCPSLFSARRRQYATRPRGSAATNACASIENRVAVAVGLGWRRSVSFVSSALKASRARPSSSARSAGVAKRHRASHPSRSRAFQAPVTRSANAGASGRAGSRACSLGGPGARRDRRRPRVGGRGRDDGREAGRGHAGGTGHPAASRGRRVVSHGEGASPPESRPRARTSVHRARRYNA